MGVYQYKNEDPNRFLQKELGMSEATIPTVSVVNLTKDIETGEKFLNNYLLIEKLGSGHNGRVYLARDIEDDKLYAIKEISKVTKLSILNKDPNEQKNKIRDEIDIMTSIIEHPKIVRLIKVLNDPKFNKIFLILEYCSKGELKFGGSATYEKRLLQAIIRDVVLGLEYLHGIGIIHRDIKPPNLLRDDENFIKISDFGISYNINATNHRKGFGTPAFLAPELVSNNNDTEDDSDTNANINDNDNDNDKMKEPARTNGVDGMIDIWSLGVSVFCLWFGRLPFNGKNEYEMFQEIVNNEIPFTQIIKDEPKKNDPSLISLLERLLDKNPRTRITLQELKTHPYLLQNLNNEEVLQFQNFNKDYLTNRNTKNNFIRSKSIQRRFRSIFKRKPTSPTIKDSPKLNLDISQDIQSSSLIDLINVSPSVRESPKLMNLSSSTSGSAISNSQSTSESVSASIITTPITSVTGTPALQQENKIPSILISAPSTEDKPHASSMSLPAPSRSGPFGPRPSLQKKLASSSNSLNLNSLLFSKKDVPNYLDDSTFFQTVDSDASSSDDDSSGDGLYNDDEDTLSFRIGPKRGSSSLQVRTVNEYLDV